MAKSVSAVQYSDLLSAALEGLELKKKQIEEQIRAVRALVGGRQPVAVKNDGPTSSEAELAPKTRRKRQLSAAARKRIAAAQKKRWAEFRKKKASGD